MSTLGMEGESMYPEEAIRASERSARGAKKEPCPWCGCPGEQYDGHVCEDYSSSAADVRVGARVTMIGRDTPYSGESGIITNSPGKVFNGWTVKLDSGPVIGVDRRYLRVTIVTKLGGPRKIPRASTAATMSVRP